MGHTFRMMTRRSIVGSAVALLLFVIPFRAVEPLPAKLSDAAFWKMITDFSEAGGYFRF